jgi:hypothetical protein
MTYAAPPSSITRAVQALLKPQKFKLAVCRQAIEALAKLKLSARPGSVADTPPRSGGTSPMLLPCGALSLTFALCPTR